MTTYIVTGLVVGSVYAIATLGLVLTYASTRIFNFAQGAIVFFLAITFYELTVDHGWNPRLAGFVTVFVISPLFGLLLWAVLFRRLSDAPPSVRLVSTIGLWVALPPLTGLIYGRDERFEFPSVLFNPPHQYKVFGVGIDSNDVAVIVAAVVLAVLLTLLLRATPFGLSVRATVDSPAMARTVGVNTAYVSAGSWMIGTTLAGTSGVLLGTQNGFAIQQFTFLILGSFAAVVIARMHSLPLAFFGSLALGVVQELSKSVQVQDFLAHFFSPQSVWIRGLPQIIPFAVMLIFLLAYSGLRSERFTTDTRRAVDTVLVDVDVATTSCTTLAPAATGRDPADRRDRGAVLPQRVVGGHRRQGPRVRDRLPLVHDRHRRRRHDLALPDHLRGCRALRSPPTSRRTTAWRC